MIAAVTDRPAMLVLHDGPAAVEQVVHVVGQTRNKYRIRAVHRTRMPGRNRWLEQGHTILVPRPCVRFTDV